MEKENDNSKDEKERNQQDQWIGKAEAYIDDAAERIHQSDAYRKAGKSVEKATKSIFRQAGKWWGKMNS